MTSYSNDDDPIELAVLGGDVGKIEWVIRDFLARGAFVLFSAEMGSGKSTLIYRAAEAIHKGRFFSINSQQRKEEFLLFKVMNQPPMQGKIQANGLRNSI